MDHTVGVVLQNLVSQANCVEFLGRRIFTYFEAERAVRGATHGMRVHAMWHQTWGHLALEWHCVKLLECMMLVLEG